MMAKPMCRWQTVALPLFIPKYNRLGNGEEVTYENEAPRHRRVEPGFSSPTWLLVGEGNVTSAMMFPDVSRTYDLRLTIGQPTGGAPNALGHIGPFPLSYSRIVVSYSQKLFVHESGDESDLGRTAPHRK